MYTELQIDLYELQPDPPLDQKTSILVFKSASWASSWDFKSIYFWARTRTRIRTRIKMTTKERKRTRTRIRIYGLKEKRQIDVKIKAARLIWPGGMSGASEFDMF